MDTTQIILVVLGALVALGAAIGIVLAVRRHRWITSLRDRGWEFVSSPDLSTVLGLGCPPFGQGFKRAVDDQIRGAVGTGQVPFQVLEYKTEYLDVRVAALRLPRPLPELYLTGGESPRRRLTGTTHPHPRWQVVTTDHDFAAAALPAMGPALDALAQIAPVDLSIDGQDLVALAAPKGADELEPMLQALAEVVRSLCGADLERFRQPPPEQRFRFHGRPDWQFHGDRDDMLGRVRHATGGFGHRAEDVLTGGQAGLTFVALRHRWKTQRTVTSSDGKGGTTTRTVTDHHSEDLFELTLPAAWPQLSVGEGGFWKAGEKIRLESEAFNDTFHVRTADPRFAYDVLHPRQMEYLMAVHPPHFEVAGSTLRVRSHHDEHWIAATAGQLEGFLARVPSWVWKNLGVGVPTFTREELG